MNAKGDGDIAGLRAQFESIPPLPAGRSQTRDQRIAELRDEIDRLAKERDRVAEKQTIREADRTIYELRQKSVIRKLEELEKISESESQA